MGVKKITTDYDLIASFQDEHDPFADDAYREFDKKYREYIYKICLKLIFNNSYIRDKKSESEDLCHLVLMKVLGPKSKFKATPNQSIEQQEKHIRTWLYKVIYSTFYDEYIKKRERRPKLVSFESVLLGEKEYDNSFESYGKSIGEEKISEEVNNKQLSFIEATAISSIDMSEFEKDVLQAYKESGVNQNGKLILPPERMQELIDKHRRQKNSIIKCKSRLLDKIKKQLQNL